MQIILLIIGFIIIIKASDLLVDASSALALNFHVPKMLIALTIAAFGTCAPEIAISFQSVSAGNGEIAFANVVGSCVVNVFLIIGLAAFIRPIKVKHATIKKELPILVIITSVFAVLMLDSIFNPYTSDTFSRSDGIILLLLFGLFIVYLIQMLFKKQEYSEEEKESIKYNPYVAIIIIIVSIILIIFSSDLIVECAQNYCSSP